jgi:hypothetical protein
MDVGRKDGDQDHDQGQGGDAAGARHQEPHGAQDLANARECHHELRVGYPGRNHGDHVGTHAGEVGGGGEAEHHGQAHARGGGPVAKLRHAQLPAQPSEEDHHDKDDERRHHDSFRCECRLTRSASTAARSDDRFMPVLRDPSARR